MQNAEANVFNVKVIQRYWDWSTCTSMYCVHVPRIMLICGFKKRLVFLRVMTLVAQAISKLHNRVHDVVKIKLTSTTENLRE